MKKITISGSASLRKEAEDWFNYFKKNNFEILDWARPIKKEDFEKEYPSIYKNFYKNLEKTDIHFIANEDKKNKIGYIGVGVFTELAFSIGRNFSRKNKIKIILLKEPSKDNIFYEDIMFWIKNGWLEISDKI